MKSNTYKIINNIKIKVYFKKEMGSLIISNYKEILDIFPSDFDENKTPKFLANKLFGNLNELLWNLGIKNSSSLMPIKTNKKMESNNKYQEKIIRYKGHNIDFYLSNTKNILSRLQQKQVYNKEKYIITPFIFLPEMNLKNLEEIEKQIYEKLYNNKIIDKNYNEITNYLKNNLSIDTRIIFIKTFLELSAIRNYNKNLLTTNKENLLKKIDIYFNQKEYIDYNLLFNNICNSDSLFNSNEIDNLFPKTNNKISTITFIKNDFDNALKTMEFFLFQKIINIDKYSYELLYVPYQPSFIILNHSYKKYYQSIYDLYNEFKIYIKQSNIAKIKDINIETFLLIIKVISDYGSIDLNNNYTYLKEEEIITPKVSLTLDLIYNLQYLYYLNYDLIFLFENHIWLNSNRKNNIIENYINELKKDNLLLETEEQEFRQEIKYLLELFPNPSQKLGDWSLSRENYIPTSNGLSELIDYNKNRINKNKRGEVKNKILRMK